MVILEDLSYDSALRYDKVLPEIFMNGRHFGMNVLMTMQHGRSVGPELRNMVGYIYVPITPSRLAQQQLYEDYFSCLPSVHHFRSILMQCTQNHECLVLDNTQATYDISKVMFYYKVPESELGREFTIKCRRQWKYHFAIGEGRHLGGAVGDAAKPALFAAPKADTRVVKLVAPTQESSGRPGVVTQLALTAGQLLGLDRGGAEGGSPAGGAGGPGSAGGAETKDGEGEEGPRVTVRRLGSLDDDFDADSLEFDSDEE